MGSAADYVLVMTWFAHRRCKRNWGFQPKSIRPSVWRWSRILVSPNSAGGRHMPKSGDVVFLQSVKRTRPLCGSTSLAPAGRKQRWNDS